jgi:hypothetical protein
MVFVRFFIAIPVGTVTLLTYFIADYGGLQDINCVNIKWNCYIDIFYFSTEFAGESILTHLHMQAMASIETHLHQRSCRTVQSQFLPD